MQDAWRAYLELALGVTEASRKKAQKVAQRLVGKGGATAAQLQALTEDLLTAGTANREALTKMVRGEVERTLGRVGLASADEVTALQERVRVLEAELSEARATSAPAAATAGGTGTPVNPAEVVEPAGPSPAQKTAQKTATKTATKAVAKKSVAKKTAAKKTAAKAGTARTATTGEPARKAAKRGAAKKTTGPSAPPEDAA